MESNRERHLEPGRQGTIAVRVRIVGVMALIADVQRRSVFGRCDDATLFFHHHCPPIDTQHQNIGVHHVENTH